MENYSISVAGRQVSLFQGTIKPYFAKNCCKGSLSEIRTQRSKIETKVIQCYISCVLHRRIVNYESSIFWALKEGRANGAV